MNYKEYIIPIGEEAKEFDEMFIGVIRKQPELIRCKDCRYYDASAKTMDMLCKRKQGCRETIPEGFCGWAIPKRKEE